MMLMLLVLPHRVVPCRFLQHMNQTYKICKPKLWFNKSDVIKLILFSTKNLLEVTSVTLASTYLENTFHIVLMMMMMMMMNCFCGMVDRRKTFSFISSRDHCQRFSPSRITDTPQEGFEVFILRM